MATSNWQKSSFSSSDGNTNCVEVASARTGGLRLREGEQPDAELAAQPHAMRGLLAHIKAGNLSIR